MITPEYLLLLAAIVFPVFGAFGVLWIRDWLQARRNGRVPVSQKLLRGAGESARREFEKLDEKLGTWFVALLVGPAMIAAIILAMNFGKPRMSSYGYVVSIAAAVILFFAATWRLIHLIKIRRNYRLGFAGERAVGEELNQLMLDGCRVFHDVPMEPYGNIDHVIVAPSGIYAVETKTRRKKLMPGKRDHEITFDGERLVFPSGIETRPIEQTRQQAERLQTFLSKAVGETVKVRAILTLPGWWVTTKARSELKVLNPKNVRSAIMDSRLSVLPKQLLDRVTHQLDQKCRDVDF